MLRHLFAATFFSRPDNLRTVALGTGASAIKRFGQASPEADQIHSSKMTVASSGTESLSKVASGRPGCCPIAIDPLDWTAQRNALGFILAERRVHRRST